MKYVVGIGLLLFALVIVINREVGIGEPEPAFIVRGSGAVLIGITAAVLGVLVVLFVPG